jgi:Fuc2NAc and GlcNAc transferase
LEKKSRTTAKTFLREILMSNLALLMIPVAGILTGFSVNAYRRRALIVGLVDVPNERSSHSQATPRGGGVAFIMIWTLLNVPFFNLMNLPEKISILAGSLIVAAIGFCDDVNSIKSSVRGFVHLSTAGMAAYASTALGLPLILVPVAALLMGWSINAFNFMDGMDGFAAMEAIFVLGVGGFIMWLQDSGVLGLSAMILAGSVAGFLFWNRPPARIFMGDAGSGFLGFIISAFALLGYLKYQISILVWAILFSLFWFDATVTLSRRVLRGEKWYMAHRSHAYQRLHHYAKWSHKKILFASIGVNCVLTGMALVGHFNPQFLLEMFGSCIIILSCLYAAVEGIAPDTRMMTNHSSLK